MPKVFRVRLLKTNLPIDPAELGVCCSTLALGSVGTFSSAKRTIPGLLLRVIPPRDLGAGKQQILIAMKRSKHLFISKSTKLHHHLSSLLISAEEDNSSTEDGEEDCEPFDDESDEDENEDGEDEETDDDEEGLLDDDDTSFCRNMIEEPGKDSGCTAVVALVSGRDLYVANAGDSRCVVCRNGKAIEMSFDHKPEDEEESDRIQKAGGKVTLDGRVNGGLNLSRAIGDHAYKMVRRQTNFT